MSLAVETLKLSRRFGGEMAVQDLHLQVPAGSVFGFLGPNGAGKTTTIRLLLGLIRPSAGRVLLNGHDVQRARAAALRGVGAIVEKPALYPHLSGREILAIAARLLGAPSTSIAELLSLVELSHAADRLVRTYSLGMRQRLALARALIGRPRLLVLDEPTNGLDPAGIAQMRQLIRELPQRFGTTVLLSSHLLGEIEQVADHCALIHRGRLIFQDRLQVLRELAPPTLQLETDRSEEALRLLQARDLQAGIDNQRLQVLGVFDAAARARLVADLVAQGIGVSGLSVERPGLETIFLRLTADEAVA